MKTLLASTAIIGLMSAPLLAQDQTKPADTAAGADAVAVILVLHDINEDGRIDAEDLKLADTNADGWIDQNDEPQMAASGSMTTDGTKTVGTDMAAGNAVTPAPAADATKPVGADQVAAADTKVATEAEMANDITGERVYDSTGEWIGEVSEMVVKDEKTEMVVKDEKTWAIVDVGGFLGIGEKPVALDLSELDIATDANNDVRVSTAFTKEELEAMPEYEKM
jgi:hypothetical protein